MKNRPFSHAARLALTLAFALTVLAPPASATDFFAIVYNSGKKPQAYIDVSIDGRYAGGPSDVLVNVFAPNGDAISEFTLRTDETGFASTTSFGNLFDLTGGEPMLVRVRTITGAQRPAATLHINSSAGPSVVGLVPVTNRDGTRLASGTVFAVALGTFSTASILIANVSGSDIAADIFKGSPSSHGTGLYTNGRIGANGWWRVDLTQNEAPNLVVTATNGIIVQVLIHDGRAIHSFMVLPWA